LHKCEFDDLFAFAKQQARERGLRPDEIPGDRILECAAAAQADYIVSGDKHLLSLK
jgi:hypothetical protein